MTEHDRAMVAATMGLVPSLFHPKPNYQYAALEPRPRKVRDKSNRKPGKPRRMR